MKDVRDVMRISDKNVTIVKMVGVERFELPTLWSQTRCATRLRYTPKYYVTRKYL